MERNLRVTETATTAGQPLSPEGSQTMSELWRAIREGAAQGFAESWADQVYRWHHPKRWSELGWFDRVIVGCITACFGLMALCALLLALTFAAHDNWLRALVGLLMFVAYSGVTWLIYQFEMRTR